MKKLENEYRQLMQNEVPDLWSRIEAGIDAKIAEGGKTENDDGVDDAWTIVTIENKKRNVINWKKYSLPLVACIAAVLCIPMLVTGFFRMAYSGRSESADMASDCAASDFAAPEDTGGDTDDDCIEIVTDDACDEEIDDAYELISEEEFEGMLSDDYDHVAETESQKEVEPESMSDGATVAGTTEEYSQYKQEVSESMQILTVNKISRKKEDTGNGRETGMVYYLDTEEVGECTLYVPDDVEFVMDFEVQLKIQVKTTDDGYDFVYVGKVE